MSAPEPGSLLNRASHWASYKHFGQAGGLPLSSLLLIEVARSLGLK